jgi:hypothetical protein
MGKLPSKPRSAFFRPPCSRSRSGSFSGRASTLACGNTTGLGRRTARFHGERGFLLTLLVPVLALFALFFLGTLRFTARAQARVALQSRLDVCAVRAAVARERLYGRLAKTNEGVNSTKLAIYAMRAAALVPGAGEVALAGQEALLTLNKSLAAAEDAMELVGETEELGMLRCKATHYSSEQATCVATPPLVTALEHEETLFPDVRGPIQHRSGSKRLATIRCFGWGGMNTTLEVRGDSKLRNWKGYEDAYTTY